MRKRMAVGGGSCVAGSRGGRDPSVGAPDPGRGGLAASLRRLAALAALLVASPASSLTIGDALPLAVGFTSSDAPLFPSPSAWLRCADEAGQGCADSSGAYDRIVSLELDDGSLEVDESWFDFSMEVYTAFDGASWSFGYRNVSFQLAPPAPGATAAVSWTVVARLDPSPTGARRVALLGQSDPAVFSVLVWGAIDGSIATWLVDSADGDVQGTGQTLELWVPMHLQLSEAGATTSCGGVGSPGSVSDCEIRLGIHEARVESVPEAGLVLLLMGGVGLLAARGRRRSRLPCRRRR